jgi:hypothetical protein
MTQLPDDIWIFFLYKKRSECQVKDFFLTVKQIFKCADFIFGPWGNHRSNVHFNCRKRSWNCYAVTEWHYSPFAAFSFYATNPIRRFQVVELYIWECKNCFLHPYEQHVNLNSSLEILLLQCCSLPCELWQKLYSVKNKKISSGNILRQMWDQLLKLLVKVNYALKPSKDVSRNG